MKKIYFLLFFLMMGIILIPDDVISAPVERDLASPDGPIHCLLDTDKD